jgi:hypothetical protein
VLVTLVHLVATKDNPLILALDDIHNISSHDIRFLRKIFSHKNTKFFLVIGTCKIDVVDEDKSGLMEAVSFIEKHARFYQACNSFGGVALLFFPSLPFPSPSLSLVTFFQIKLKPLTPSETITMITSMLGDKIFVKKDQLNSFSYDLWSK